MKWNLPDWAEIVRAEPPVLSDGSVYLGRVAPGDDRQSLIVVRVRTTVGVTVPFDIIVIKRIDLVFSTSVAGTASRLVVSSAVSTNLATPVTFASMGASIPVEIRNAGQSSLETAVFRIIDGPGTVAGDSNVFLSVTSAQVLRALSLLIFRYNPQATRFLLRGD